MCLDCDNVYDINVRRIEAEKFQKASNTEEPPTQRKRKIKTDYRAEIQAVAPPKIPFNTTVVEEAIAKGPAGVRQAQRIALKYAERFQEQTEDRWRRNTKFLQGLMDNSDTSNRARARWARQWRPRFLAALSVTNSVLLSARYARVARASVYAHRQEDPEFAKMWDEAIEQALDLLHSRVFQRCIEGDLEPIMYMGVPVGWMRKFSDKLQIEMLRAWKPDRFKTPGTQINLGVKQDIFVLSEDQRHELQAINREFLLSSPTVGPLETSNLPMLEAATPAPASTSSEQG